MKHLRVLLGAFLAILLSLGGLSCRSPARADALQRFSFAGLHMATMFQIVLYAPDEALATRASEAAFTRIAALEDIMSDYDPRSELMQLCGKPAGQFHRVSADLFVVLSQAQRLAAETDGAFDVTLGPLIQLWRSSRKSGRLPDQTQVESARGRTGWRKLRLDPARRAVLLESPEMRLDLGGIAKGYAADQALSALRSLGISRAMVAAGGDIAVGDAPPGKPGWTIGIDSLDARVGAPSPTLLLRQAGISTSGDTEQFVEIDGRRYSHIVDPATGLGLTNRIGVSIVAPDATTSDATATAVSVLGMARGLAFVERHHRLAARVVTAQDQGNQVIESGGYTRRKKMSESSRRRL
jgi:thiamine biosynthesis lipoprotein